MKLKEIHRTSTFAWSPLSSIPLLATGTVAGALDESFSNDSQLEIWAPEFMNKQEYELGGEGQPGPRGVVTNSARFNRIAWGNVDGNRPQGVIAAGMENGELAIWDPEKIVAQADPSESLIFKNNTHTGPIRGLDFNPIQTNLFSSGGINGEIYIWDLKDPSKPYSPGARSSKLDEITALAWNNQVPHVLSTSSSTGYTVVWDLRGKREVVALAYGGGAGTIAGSMQGNGMAVGGRRGMSDVAWHPENATRLVTSSEDDASPVIMVWDLRNARAPEKILTGHEKGVLSLSWCKQDPDLLLSSGKDNRALCWNPQTSEIIGELPSADNWAFQVQWCPRNPDLLAAAFFDGTVGVHSIQSTNEPAPGAPPTAAPQANGADVFDDLGFARTTQATLSLKQPPKWLRRPTSVAFGYGGQLVTVSNLPSAQGKNQSSAVHLRKVITEEDIVERAGRLRAAQEAQDLPGLAEERSKEAENAGDGSAAGWKALLSLFRADSRDELVTLLGFSKAEIALRVAEAVEKINTASQEDNDSTPPKSPVEQVEDDAIDTKRHEPVVSFVEPGISDDVEGAVSVFEQTPSEVSASATSDTTNAAPIPDGESTTTAPSLFGDDNAVGTPAADFFSTMGLSPLGNEGDQVVPHTNYGLDSSVAATIGSGPSSVASETLKGNTFHIYPSDESETDRLVTKALVVGDFQSAVSLCLSSDRFADAILLAVKGGPDLLARTQKAYFERCTTSLPYLRLFQSIVTNDLADIVQNADLREWQEIFVVLCTFATQDEFSNLAEQLGSRLEFQSRVANAAEGADGHYFRKNAMLTYLAAGRLERLVNIWVDELSEVESRVVADEGRNGVSQYTAHAQALQEFIEKVTVFRAATKYVDPDLQSAASSEEANVRAYKLAGLYDRYFEYADLLATQGLVQDAVTLLSLTPSAYSGSSGSRFDLAVGRERLLVAAGASRVPTATSSLAGPSAAAVPTTIVRTVPTAPARNAPLAPTTNPYGAYGAPIHHPPTAPAPPAATPYDTFAPAAPAVPPARGAYAPPQQNVRPTYQPTAPSAYGANSGYNPPLPPSHLAGPPQPPTMPPPPRPFSGAGSAAPPLGPPPKRQDHGGWNDAPSLPTERRGTPSSNHKPSAITSPFPSSSPGVTSPTYLGRGQSPAPMPPPPRPASVTARGQQPPPPPGGQRISIAPPPAGQPGPYQVPPQSTMGPPGQQMPPRQPPVTAYAPPQRGHVSGPPPPGPYARATPPPGAGPSPPGPGGVPPPHAQGGFARPGQVQQPPPPGPYGPSGSPVMQQGAPRPGPPPGPGSIPPQGFSGPPPPAAPARAPPPPKAPAGPKYPPGDRSHIPASLRPVYEVVSENLARLKQITPPQQKRLYDDLERRINPLFDALNCETLSPSVVEMLLVLTKAMENHDRQLALQIHVDILTRSMGDDIALWMSGIKQLIMRL
ncbi:hypothetical protein OF83DRAFT_1172526 [Amylostereum chailletii]|nr:hypothetical protein OF83DRAFT_1172526 [Amylostereum chailletii]